LVVIKTLTVGLLLTFLVGVGGFNVYGTGEDVSVGTATEGVSVGVSVTSTVLVGIAVSVGVKDGVSVGGGSLVGV
jgi:hypothetical protein